MDRPETARLVLNERKTRDLMEALNGLLSDITAEARLLQECSRPETARRLFFLADRISVALARAAEPVSGE